MELKALILHGIEKERYGASTLRLSPDELPLDDRAEKFVEAIRKAYSKRSNTYWGTFHADTENYPFQVRLAQYIGDNDIGLLSERSMQILQKEIKDKTFATGGYVVFIHFEEHNQVYLIVAMLQDREGFSVDPSTMTLRDAPHLNIDQVKVAGRINMTSWQNEEFEGNYVSFLRGGTEVSNYFQDFIGCTENTSTRDATARLVKAMKSHLGHLDIGRDERERRFNRAAEYIIGNSSIGESVRLDAVAPLIDEDDPTAFIERAVSEEYGVSAIFRAHRQTVQRAMYHEFSSTDLKIKFNDRLIEKSVNWMEQEGVLVIQVPEEWHAELTATFRNKR